MSDLTKIGSLLTLHGAGVIELSYRGGSEWISAAHAYRRLPTFEHVVWEGEPQITALPLERPGHYLERVPSSLIWTRTSTGRSINALRRFRPAPDVVIREGATVRYVAFWAMREPLNAWDLEQANKRLAKHFQTGYGPASQDFVFYLPGAVLRAHRKRPVHIGLVKYEIPDQLHTFEDVVGPLPDPPSEEEKRDMMLAAKEREAAAAKRRQQQRQRELEQAAEIGVELA